MTTDADTLWVHSHVSAASGDGYVVLSWGKNQAQMTITEATTLALGIIQAAHAAENDALLCRVLGGHNERTGLLLMFLRDLRSNSDRFNSFKAGYAAGSKMDD